MQIKSFVIRSLPSSTGALLSLANSFKLKRNVTHGYTMPNNDQKEITSHWNEVGRGLQLALNEYGKRYGKGYYKNTTR